MNSIEGNKKEGIKIDANDYNRPAEEVELDNEDSQTSSKKDIATNEEENIYPMKEIKVDKGFFTTYELKRKYDKKPSLVVLDSDFQRKDVWNLQQKRELIESVLMGLPLPIFYLNEDKKGRLIVIDGRQRLTALFEFIDNKFSLDKLKIFTELKKISFSDLDPAYQSQIEDYQIMAHVIKPPTPDKIKFDIFDRVNRAGTQLNKQEIRNALYQGKSTLLLSELSKTEEFAEATEHTFDFDKRMKDRYILSRFIGFYLWLEKRLKKDNLVYEYNSDVDELLGVTMEYLNNLDNSSIEEIKNVTIRALSQAVFYLGDNAFRLIDTDKNGKTKRYPININIFENILYAMTQIPYCEESVKCFVKRSFDSMKNNLSFRDSINNHRDNIIKVNYRFDLIKRMVGEINDR